MQIIDSFSNTQHLALLGEPVSSTEPSCSNAKATPSLNVFRRDLQIIFLSDSYQFTIFTKTGCVQIPDRGAKKTREFPK